MSQRRSLPGTEGGGVVAVNPRQLPQGKQKHKKEYLESEWKVSPKGEISCLNKGHI